MLCNLTPTCNYQHHGRTQTKNQSTKPQNLTTFKIKEKLHFSCSTKNLFIILGFYKKMHEVTTITKGPPFETSIYVGPNQPKCVLGNNNCWK